MYSQSHSKVKKGKVPAVAAGLVGNEGFDDMIRTEGRLFTPRSALPARWPLRLRPTRGGAGSTFSAAKSPESRGSVELFLDGPALSRPRSRSLSGQSSRCSRWRAHQTYSLSCSCL